MRVVAIALLSLAAGLAEARAQGVNLAWDACLSEGGLQAKTSACLSNTGASVAWGSFVAGGDHPDFVGCEVIVDLQAEGAALPDWWQFFNSGSCRKNALSASFDFTSAPQANCADPWLGQGVGGLAAYQTVTTIPAVPGEMTNSARIKLAAALSAANPLGAATEYYCFKLTISNAGTVGTGSCAGCGTAVCLVLSEVKVAESTGPVERLTSPAIGSAISWQGGQAICAAMAPQNAMWGQIQTILR